MDTSITTQDRYKWLKGRKLSEETKNRISESTKGEKHWNWKGGVSKDTERKRKLNNERRNKNPVAILENRKRTKEWKKSHPKQTYFQTRKRILMKRSVIGSHNFNEWEILKLQYDLTCPHCKKREPEIKLTEDHIIPIIKGGSNNIENIQPLCRSCNSKKYTKIIKYESID